MKCIGILAYGSLIDDPGKELNPLVRERISNVKTPFCVEFARSSRSRDGAPTLVPVPKGGDCVKGVILLLDPSVDIKLAKDLLWRRETRNEDSDRHYKAPDKIGPDTVVVECLQNLVNVETVLYTKIRANIANLTAEHLADLAICSARKEAGAKRMDGISYLISVKKQNIETPLMQAYEEAILKKTGASDLFDAYERIRQGKA